MTVRIADLTSEILLLSHSTTLQRRRVILASANELRKRQFSNVTEGLEQGTTLLEAIILDHQLLITSFSREFIFLLVKLLTSTYANSFLLRIPRYTLSPISYNHKLRRWLFSVTPNHRFLPILGCDETQSPNMIILTYSLVLSERLTVLKHLDFLSSR
jgi:hypothetical protein